MKTKQTFMQFVSPLILAGAFGLSGCGDGGNDNPLVLEPEEPDGEDGVIDIVAQGNAGDPVDVSLVDSGAAEAPETLNVPVVNLRTGESETVTLVEDPLNLGNFTVSLPTADDGAAGANDDGVLNVQGLDTVEVTYTDAFDGTNTNVVKTDQVQLPESPLVPTEGINGIWFGQFRRPIVPGQEPQTYSVDMLFYTVPGEEEGKTVGTAFQTFPEPVDVSNDFLLAGGYQIVTGLTNQEGDLVCDGWGVGRFGEQATFLREFSYETGSQAGPEQRGAMCLQLDGNTLTGQASFEAYGVFEVTLFYSQENARDTGVADIAGGGSDAEMFNLWSNDNTGVSMQYGQTEVPTADTLRIDVIETSTGTCGGEVVITDIPNLNMFTMETFGQVEGCNYTVPGFDVSDVDLSYIGLGTLGTDEGGSDAFIHLMSSIDNVDAAQALYNVFTLFGPLTD